MKDHLQQLVAGGKTEKAIKELIHITSRLDEKDLYQEVILQSSRFEQYAKEKRLGTASYDHQRISIADITIGLLEIIEKLPNVSTPTSLTKQVSSSATLTPTPIQTASTYKSTDKKSIWISIVSLLAAAILFGFMVVYQDSLGSAGPLGEIFFLLLLGILAGVAFFELMPSRAEGDGKIFGVNLKFSGPIIAGIAVAVGGYFFLQSSIQGPFGFTISLQVDKSIIVPSAYPTLKERILQIRLGDEWKPANGYSNSDADFKNIAGNYRNNKVAVALDARYWQLTEDSVKLKGKSQTLFIKPDGSLSKINGIVKDFITGKTIEGARVSIQGEEAFSTKYGEYILPIPADKQRQFQTIRAYKAGYQDYEMSEVPIETDQEIPIMMKPEK